MRFLALLLLLVSLFYQYTCQSNFLKNFTKKNATSNYCPNTPKELAKIDFSKFRVVRKPGETPLQFLERCKPLIY